AGVRSDVAVALRKDGRLLGSAPLARQTPHDARYVPATGRRRSRCHFGKKSCSGHEPPISVHPLATSPSPKPPTSNSSVARRSVEHVSRGVMVRTDLPIDIVLKR